MATGWLNAISEGHFYIGLGKQSAWDTPVAPTCFHQWLDGTTADAMPGYNQDRSGTDGILDFSWKTGQYWQIVVAERVRPQSAGYAIQAAMRSGSDTYTAPTFGASTLGASVAAGDTSFTTATNLGSSSTLGMNIEPGYNSTKYEVVVVDLSTKGGSGPFTYSLASGTSFKFAHSNTTPLTSASLHTFTPQIAPFDPYSYEFGWGSAAFGIQRALRTTNAVCKQLRISGQKGQPLAMQHTWYATAAVVQAALASVTYENTNQVGQAGAPFKWYDGNLFKINGGTTLNAAQMDGFDLTFDNDVTPEDLQSEALLAHFFMPGNYTVGGSLGYVFNSYAQYDDALFGTTAATTSSTDSPLLGMESAEVKFALDTVNTLDISVPNIFFQAPKLQPRRTAHGLHQQLQFSSIRPLPSMTPTTPVTIALSNSKNAAY